MIEREMDAGVFVSRNEAESTSFAINGAASRTGRHPIDCRA